MQRKKLILGNWKMHKTLMSASQDFQQIAEYFHNKKVNLELGIAAPSLFLSQLSKLTRNSVSLYAQNVHWESQGAYTGEVSVPMLKEISVCGSLVAHSERRTFFAETDATAGKRLGALLKQGMRGVLCVGETLPQRESGKYLEIIANQIQVALNATGLRNSYEFIGSNPCSPLFSIAYEPVWAIGTGKAASAEQAQEVHAMIRSQLYKIFNENTSNSIKILYGGSVKPNNIKSFLTQPDIDGALVGGASLVPKDFIELCESYS